MAQSYYKGFRRIKVKPAREKARWWWVRVIDERDGWLVCERVNKNCEHIKDGTVEMISPGAILESHEARENLTYGELEVVKKPQKNA